MNYTSATKKILFSPVSQVPQALSEVFADIRANAIEAKRCNMSTLEGLIYANNGRVDTLVVHDVSSGTTFIDAPNAPAINDELYHVTAPISAQMTVMARGSLNAANDDHQNPAEQRRADVEAFKNSKIGQDMMARYGLSKRPPNPFEPK